MNLHITSIYGRTLKRYEKNQKWNKVFAWGPIRIDDDVVVLWGYYYRRETANIWLRRTVKDHLIAILSE